MKVYGGEKKIYGVAGRNNPFSFSEVTTSVCWFFREKNIGI